MAEQYSLNSFPPELMKVIVGNLDFTSRVNLKRASKITHSLVGPIPPPNPVEMLKFCTWTEKHQKAPPGLKKRACSWCEWLLPVDHFSDAQLRVSARKRMCIECGIAAGTYSPTGIDFFVSQVRHGVCFLCYEAKAYTDLVSLEVSRVSNSDTVLYRERKLKSCKSICQLSVRPNEIRAEAPLKSKRYSAVSRTTFKDGY
ncbi:MAG: hypothetical protein M1827_003455 [Pycnora praestabilis]|nr:MAG: hypothetical protein M1827_003455 [Pycnora praestabilis]